MGRVLVRALLDTGVQVAVLDLPASLAQNPPPSQALAFPMDGSDAGSVEAAFAELASQWPHLDGFANLAGFFKGFQPVKDLPVEVFDEVIAGNLRCMVSPPSAPARELTKPHFYGVSFNGG